MSYAGTTPVSGGPRPGLPLPRTRSAVIHGDCLTVLPTMPAASVDFILTDPPYLVNYRSREGVTIANDNNPAWVKPAFGEMHRVLKPRSLCLSFYGWNKVDLFVDAWRTAGFRMVGHLVFAKRYASSCRYLEHRHEQAYLLAKGDAPLPAYPLPDVRDWAYTGNRLHPTQKPTRVLQPLVETFCRPAGTVLDPFCGSGSTLVAANDAGRNAIGIELDAVHYRTAAARLDAA